MVLAALGSQLQIPESICKIIIFMLLAKIGLTGGMAIRNSNLTEMVLPVAFSILLGILIVFIARYTLAKLPKVKTVDAIATGGLFGAVSGSTMAAALALLDEQKVAYEAWTGALYPFIETGGFGNRIKPRSFPTGIQNSSRAYGSRQNQS